MSAVIPQEQRGALRVSRSLSRPRFPHRARGERRPAAAGEGIVRRLPARLEPDDVIHLAADAAVQRDQEIDRSLSLPIDVAQQDVGEPQDVLHGLLDAGP